MSILNQKIRFKKQNKKSNYLNGFLSRTTIDFPLYYFPKYFIDKNS